MKKYVKLIFGSIVFPVVSLFLVSCNDDNSYSLDKSWISIVTVNKLSDNTYDFTLDNGKRMWMAAPAGAVLQPKYARAILNYTILGNQIDGYDYYIKLNSFYDVLTKGVIYADPNDTNKQDSIGNDPIKVYSIWEGGGYLNIWFAFNAGGVNSHMLNLVSASPDLSVNSDTVKLEFRHNRKGDPERYPVNGYVSFNLAPYKISGRDKVTFEVTAKDIGGDNKVYIIEYDYGTSASKVQEIKLDENALTPSLQ